MNRFLDVDRPDRLKVLLLALIYGLIIGSYTIARELKNAVFVNIVGKNHIPPARWLSMIFLIPAILGYAALVDRLKRYQLLCVCAIFFGLSCLVFTFFIGQPSIGLLNTETSIYRVFGWFFYFFVEAFSPFLVSVMWAFSNSITDPHEAKSGYPLMVAGSKIGGIICSGLAILLCKNIAQRTVQARAADVMNYQIMLGVASLLLLCVPFVVLFLMKKVPQRHLHGYEATYEVEKKHQGATEEKETAVSLFAGLVLLIRYPYVCGIFGMVFFYEVTDAILSFIRIGIAHETATTLSQEAIFLLSTAFQAHLVGLFFSIFGTKTLLKFLGERICLLLIPLLIGSLILMYTIYPTSGVFMVVIALLKAVHYAFSMPVRESLYIPTVNEIRFKSKSWIDAFGGKVAKSSGSVFNFVLVTWFSDHTSSFVYTLAHTFIFAIIIGLWFITAHLLGKKFENTVKNNQVIGSEQ